MDGFRSHAQGGSLHISTDALEKITRHAALEIEGVKALRPAAFGGNSWRERLMPPRAVLIQTDSDVADISVSIVVAYGTKIPEISTLVQENIKNSVQNMTGITVGRVDIMVSGVAAEGKMA